MSSLAELPELVGFFSYSREDDEDSEGGLSRLRDRIQRELGSQLGRSRGEFRLWQDKAAIAHGTFWQNEIDSGIAQSVFFIPIVTPRAIKSSHCGFEFDSFLAREAALGRDDLVFPILYIPVPALEKESLWRADPILKVVGTRQYLDWQDLRHHDLASTDVRVKVEHYCRNICNALRRPWEPPAERRQREEAQARQVADEEGRRAADAERQRLEREAAAQREAEEQSQAAAAAAERQRWERDAAAQREGEDAARREQERLRAAEEVRRRPAADTAAKPRAEPEPVSSVAQRPDGIAATDQGPEPRKPWRAGSLALLAAGLTGVVAVGAWLAVTWQTPATTPAPPPSAIAQAPPATTPAQPAPGSVGPSSPNSQGPIKVGILHSLSGAMAITESTLKDVMLMLIDQQNARGGLLGRKLEAVVVDPASNWPLFAEKARELIVRDQVAVVFGGWTSVSRKSMLPVFKALDSILFYPAQYEGEESERNIFYTGAAPNQ
jgi:hypothetical protein